MFGSIAVLMLMITSLSSFLLLPFRFSSFSKLSGGFPSRSLYRVCFSAQLVDSLVNIAISTAGVGHTSVAWVSGILSVYCALFNFAKCFDAYRISNDASEVINVGANAYSSNSITGITSSEGISSVTQSCSADIPFA